MGEILKKCPHNSSVVPSCYGREVKATDLNSIQGHLFHFVSVGSNPTGSVFFRTSCCNDLRSQVQDRCTDQIN